MDFTPFKQSGLTIVELAAITGVSRQSLTKYLSTGATPSRSYQGVDVAATIQCALDELAELVVTGRLRRALPALPTRDPEIKRRRSEVVAKIGLRVRRRLDAQSTNR